MSICASPSTFAAICRRTAQAYFYRSLGAIPQNLRVRFGRHLARIEGITELFYGRPHPHRETIKFPCLEASVQLQSNRAPERILSCLREYKELKLYMASEVAQREPIGLQALKMGLVHLYRLIRPEIFLHQYKSSLASYPAKVALYTTEHTLSYTNTSYIFQPRSIRDYKG